ncbi:non-ribosomal peptide synthetase [Brevibacillus dissolubilis]|uniref:non-ribosomal peptide synthetase n=1 Tax=Brevibacillus dissolubilis TaxID=1844116 RepID=UPI0011164256|nr:non-ribosomal peptide synthetase [Brevibacillus dissolubilis]
MTEFEILMGFKSGKYTSEEVLAFYEKQNITVKYPLSEGQKGLWMLHKLDPTSDVYNIPVCFRIRAKVDIEKLKQAFAVVVTRHEQLSCLVSEEEGVPYLVPQPFRDHTFSATQIHIPVGDELISLLRRELKKPIDLYRDPLIRMNVYSATPTDHVVLVVVHHLVFDGASTSVFLSDLFATYEALVKNGAVSESDEFITYDEFLEWELNYLDGEQSRADRGYWLDKLDGELPSLTLDIERQNEVYLTSKGATFALPLTGSEHSAISQFCTKHRVKPTAFFLSIFQTLLQRYTGEKDLIIGMPTMGRPKFEFYQAIGYFVNMMPMRSMIHDDLLYSDYLSELNVALAENMDHATYPFPRMVKDLNIQSNLQAPPVFQVTYTFQNKNLFTINASTPTLGEIEFVEQIGQEGEFKISLEVFEEQDRFVLCLKYDANKFDAQDIASMMGHYQNLITAVIANPSAPIGSYSYLSEAERNQVLIGWNQTKAPFPSERCLHDFFEEHASAHPEAIALEYDGKQMSYAELNARANQVAAYLRQSGVKTDTVVALCAERSFEMVIGIYGIVKAGGAYLPIDPAYPADRVTYMVENAGVTRMLTLSYLADSLPLEGMDVAYLDTDEDSSGRKGVFSTQPTANVSRAETGLGVHNLAYVIYTSGSTGLPKAVMVEHRALTNRIDWMQKAYSLDTSDVVLQKTPFSFDVSVWEFFWPLITGARMVIAKPGGHADPAYLSALIQSTGVTTLHFVPSMFRIMLGEDAWKECTTIRRVFCSGEALPPDLVKRHYAQNQAALINLYGPTEAAIDVSYWNCPNTSGGSTVPIGKPIQNVKLYVLNDQLSPQAVGFRGQLYIGGDCLARGYLNNPALTSEKFIPDPFSNEPGARLYKTGDVVRWLKDGNLEYCGRIDHQVKIRGMRIELGEIEAKLNDSPDVDAAVVLVREDTPGDQRLVAYVVLAEGVPSTDVGGKLSTFMKETLPDYMVPRAFVVLDEIPVTTNGKVNRAALPVPESDSYASEAYVAPSTATEALLVDIWTEVLGFDAGKIGVNDNFFALGGHSLLVPKVLSRLHDHQVMADIRSVFNAPTLASLAAEIDSLEVLETYVVPPNKIPEGCTDITPDMLTLVALDRQEIESIVETVPGGAANIQDIYPLAPLQEGILFHHLMDPENDPYVLSGLFSFENRARLDQFVTALQHVIDRNDVLRTAVVSKGVSQPVQVVYREAKLNLDTVTLAPGIDAESHMRGLLQGPHVMNINLAPMIQLKTACDSHTGVWYVLFHMHHLIDDATSLRFLFAEVIAYLKGEEAGLSKPIPYREFVGYAIQQKNSVDAKTYFEGALGDVDEPTALFGLTNVHGDGSSVKDLRKTLPAQLSGHVRALAKRMHLSPASLFHAAWAMVIATCAGRDDVVFGTVLSGRMQGIQGGERMLGNVINTLPLRVNLTNKSVKQILHDTDRALRELIGYEQASLSLAQSCSGLDSDIPLFNAMINFRSMGADGQNRESDFVQFGMKSLVGVVERTNYPMLVSIDDEGDHFSIEVQVDQTLSCESIIGYLENALAGIVSKMEQESTEDTLASMVNILPESEWEQVVNGWNRTERPYPNDVCIHEVFQSRVQENPDRTAIVYQDTTVTYGELDRISTELAFYLTEKGAGPDRFIALVVERSVEMVAGLLGVLKAGAAYIPIDPETPEDRLAYILTDSKAVMVLTLGKYKDRVSKVLDHMADTQGAANRPTLVDLNDTASWQPLAQAGHAHVETPKTAVTNENLAYVIYTSGTTGNPKGVCVTHKSILNTLHFLEEMYPVGSNDAYLLKTNYSFDVSISELFGWFIGNGHLVILPPGDEKSPQEIIRHIQSYGVTHINFVPSVLSVFLQTAQTSPDSLANCPLKYLMVAGEAFPKELVAQAVATFKQAKVENIYGPTEVSIYGTYFSCSDHEIVGTATPIGRPIANAKAYIVDRHLKPTPIGVPGELCIAGAGLAQGYLNNEPLTQEKFIDNPFAAGTKLYRTGDLVRWLPDGQIEYLGRLDFQVKIRGLRIELGEIEHQLNIHPAVSSSVVVKHELIKGEDALVAYPAIEGKSASACHHILSMQEDGTLTHDDLYDLPNGMQVCGVSRHETDILYRDHFSNTFPDVSLKAGDCVLDIGANIGMFGLSLASKVEGLRIYSYEPVPSIYEILSKNSRILGGNTIIPIHAGFSSSVKEAQYDYYPGMSLLSGGEKELDTLTDIIDRRGYLTDAGQQGDTAYWNLLEGKAVEKQHVQVSLTTITEQIRALGLTSITFVRIDVHHGALDILDGVEEQDWAKIQQFAITVSPADDEIRKLKERLTAHGYQVSVASTYPEGSEGGMCNLIAKRGEIEAVKPLVPVQTNDVDLKYVGPKKVEELLLTHLKSRLPAYMVPSRLILMSKLPLNQNGKVDRKALPVPEKASQSHETYVGPQNQTEELLVAIWAELLDTEADKISVTDSFFSLGGHSLLVTRMLNRIKQSTGVELPIKMVFTSPTVSAIAEELQELMPEAKDSLAVSVDKILESIEMIEGLSEEELSRLFE